MNDPKLEVEDPISESDYLQNIPLKMVKMESESQLPAGYDSKLPDMDGNNLMPAVQVGEAAVEGGDWRATLQAGSRQGIRNKIMDILKMHLPFSGEQGLQELETIAERFEGKIYNSATSQSDYLRRISFKMLTMKSKSQPVNSAGNSSKPPDPGVNMQASVMMSPSTSSHLRNPLASVQQSTQSMLQQQLQQQQVILMQQQQHFQQLMSHLQSRPGQLQQQLGLNQQIISLQREMQKRLQALGQSMNMQSSVSSMHPNNMSNIHHGLSSQLMMNSLQAGSNTDSGQRNAMASSLGTTMGSIQQNSSSASQQANIGGMSSQSGMTMLQQSQHLQSNSNMLQQQQVLQSQQFEQRQMQFLQHQHQQQLGPTHQNISLQREMQQRLQASVLPQQKLLYQSTSLDSTETSGVDWQEEFYQKIKAMKEMYLPELNEMYQKIATKLEQHDSLPQQPKSDQLEKLKMFKTMLDRMINFLQVPKENVIPSFKDKLGSYEKQIVSFLSANRPKKPMPQSQHLQSNASMLHQQDYVKQEHD